MSEIDGTDFVFVYREIDAYTAVPLVVGAYFESEVVSEELDRLRNSILIGLAAILISVFVAVIVGRRLARPVKRLSAAAQLVSQMNLDGIDDLPSSRVIELDHQSEAFNAMRGALKWFQAYVPRALVNQLIKAGDMTGLESDSRNVTVMFTDIAGYSTISEGKNAAEITRMLNHHFSISDRGDRGGGRHCRQVHRRQCHGLLGRPGEAEEPVPSAPAARPLPSAGASKRTTASARGIPNHPSACGSASIPGRPPPPTSAVRQGSTTR